MAMNRAIEPSTTALLVGPGEADAVDEGGHAHDGRGQGVAGEQAHQHGAAEDLVGEQAQVEEGLGDAQHAPMARTPVIDGHHAGDGDDRQVAGLVADERDRQQRRW